MARFTDRVAVVTGAGSGPRARDRPSLRRRGRRRSPSLDLDVEAAEKAAAEIGERGGSARAYRGRRHGPAVGEDRVDGVAADLGRPQVLVNSAGIGGFAHTEEETYERWSAIIGVNLTGTFLMCRVDAAAPARRRRRDREHRVERRAHGPAVLGARTARRRAAS